MATATCSTDGFEQTRPPSLPLSPFFLHCRSDKSDIAPFARVEPVIFPSRSNMQVQSGNLQARSETARFTSQGTMLLGPEILTVRADAHARAPVNGGGPLNSHPVDANEYNDYKSDDPSKHLDAPTNSTSASIDTDFAAIDFEAGDSSSFKNIQRRPSGVRKLLSFSTLRSSTPRPSLSIGRDEMDDFGRTPTKNPLKRPASLSPSASSLLNQQPTIMGSQAKRPAKWFKRGPGFILSRSRTTLAADRENTEPEVREAKRFKASPAPSLPEVDTLAGAQFNGGSLGWDNAAFTYEA
ncbi:hypothetical protein K470DRAFT_254734 [Piedraia hortae CBS 480.64]|uniref:Uncharacterized protein n=1 Tax=Piedraia hortae CBS 480.64 TaxID=1314780 RepID=A0A6A7C8N1_9PEZI|nr:hypothetical protein K470DRAFT_254734 [Piedraia hortae CBS 480.64]